MLEHILRYDNIQIIAFFLSAIALIHFILFGKWMDRFSGLIGIVPRIDSFLARHESAITCVVVAIVIIVAILWRTYHPPFRA